jgi:hypothetical protein
MASLRRASVAALCAALTIPLAGCGGSSLPPPKNLSAPVRTDLPAYLQDVAMTRPGAYNHHLASADILVQSQEPLPADVLTKVKATKGVVASVQFSMATFYAEESPITYAAVDPATFRRFTYGTTAALDEIWDRVADGEIALRSDLKQSLATTGDVVSLGNDDDAQSAHIGAYAPLVERSNVGAVVNERWADKLGMPKGNALYVSTGNHAPDAALKELRQQLGRTATVTLLAPNVDPNVALSAVLTGGSAARAVGSFTYTANRDGTVNPDPRWVGEYIRTEQVPILGAVRCNKVMLVQLRAALTDIVRNHLAKSIHPSEYGGCYVPRYIAKDPSKGLSFHTFGTAIDVNVPGNQRGTAGTIDRRVVEIMKRWGFAWGGDWNYTDPMHFELASIVKVRGRG